MIFSFHFDSSTCWNIFIIYELFKFLIWNMLTVDFCVLVQYAECWTKRWCVDGKSTNIMSYSLNNIITNRSKLAQKTKSFKNITRTKIYAHSDYTLHLTYYCKTMSPQTGSNFYFSLFYLWSCFQKVLF